MPLLRLTAATIALIGFTAAVHADEADAAAASSTETVPAASASAAPAESASAVRTLIRVPPETEADAGWATKAKEPSSILAQASAVYAALVASAEIAGNPALTPQRIEVASLDGLGAGRIPEGNGSFGCQTMEIPGSRIREERCYFPSESEQALNYYQFRDDIQFTRQQQEILELQRAEAEAFIQRGGANSMGLGGNN